MKIRMSVFRPASRQHYVAQYRDSANWETGPQVRTNPRAKMQVGGCPSETTVDEAKRAEVNKRVQAAYNMMVAACREQRFVEATDARRRLVELLREIGEPYAAMAWNAARSAVADN